MEGNGIIEVNGHIVCFGTKAGEIFANFLIEQEKLGVITNWDWFVGLLYAGLVNEDYNQRRPYTSFADASLLADKLDSKIQDAIYACYEASKPGQSIQKNLEEMLGTLEKKSDPKALKAAIKEMKAYQTNGHLSESMQPKTESIPQSSDA